MLVGGLVLVSLLCFSLFVDDEDFIDHDGHERVPIDYSTARPSAPSFSNNNTVSSKLGDDHFTTTTTTPSSKLSDYTTTATTTTTTTATTEPPSAPPLELSTDTSSERNTCKVSTVYIRGRGGVMLCWCCGVMLCCIHFFSSIDLL